MFTEFFFHSSSNGNIVRPDLENVSSSTVDCDGATSATSSINGRLLGGSGGGGGGGGVGTVVVSTVNSRQVTEASKKQKCIYFWLILLQKSQPSSSSSSSKGCCCQGCCCCPGLVGGGGGGNHHHSRGRGLLRLRCNRMIGICFLLALFSVIMAAFFMTARSGGGIVSYCDLTNKVRQK